jgi:hypothetical protein
MKERLKVIDGRSQLSITADVLAGKRRSAFTLIKGGSVDKRSGVGLSHHPKYACGSPPESPCEDEDCQECCQHEYDPGEGMMCVNCSKEYPY